MEIPPHCITHESDIEHLLSTSSRLSAIQIAATSHVHPSLRNQIRKSSSSSKNKGRFRTTSARFTEGMTLTLTMSNQCPRFHSTEQNITSLFPHSCMVSVLVDAEPPFCFSSSTEGNVDHDLDLGAQVASTVNAKICSRAQTKGIRHQRTSLLELVAMCEKACTDHAAAAEDTVASLSSAMAIQSQRRAESVWKKIMERKLSSRMTLALLDMASRAVRGSTLSDPNPFSDSLIPIDKRRMQLTRVLNLLLVFPTNINDFSRLPSETIEFMSWMLCPEQGSRMQLLTQAVDPARLELLSQHGETKTKTPSRVAAKMMPRWCFDVRNNSESPKFVRLAKTFGIVQGYHGTDAQNVWSCLQNGLLQMSGTNMETNGAAFGDGVYLSEILPVSLFYAKAWSPTLRFQRTFPECSKSSGFRFVFECEVINDPTHRAFKDRDGKPLKDSYLVVQDSKQVRITKLLIFDDVPDLKIGKGTAATTATTATTARNSNNSSTETPTNPNPNQREVSEIASIVPALPSSSPSNGIAEDRSNGDDMRSRLICVVAVGLLWLLFYFATERMHARQRSFLDDL